MSAQPLSLLLLEDDPADAELVMHELEGLDRPVQVRRVDSSSAFAAALEEHAPDVILSDYNLPAFSGVQALALSKAHRPDVPFIFVTGALGEERAVEVFGLGATDYVLKDKLERLVPCVRRALAEARERAERRTAERALGQSRRALETLMSNLPGMAFRVVSTAPGARAFDYASAGALELTGYPSDVFLAGGAAQWEALVHPDDIERLRCEVARALAERRQSTIEYRIKTRSGDEKWVWERSVGIDDDGVAALEGFVMDVTELHLRAEEAKIRSEFEQQLIGIVSHDLRNPLNVIEMGTSLLQRREDLDAGVMRTLVRIRNAGQRATRLIHDLLDFTQTRLGGSIPLDRKLTTMHALVAPVVDEVNAAHPDREIVVQAEEDVVGEWDSERLTQALGNLVTNAIRYGAPHTPVTIRSSVKDGLARIEVHNTGSPISATVRPLLFSPMQRGTTLPDRQTRSVGLGLYIVHEIARGHGGSVDVTSSAEDGTTFSLLLPLRCSEAGASGSGADP